MNRIDKKFRKLKADRKKACIVYITAGYPDLHKTKRLIPALERAGADIVELGIPFSDPLADGPTIQAASQEALKNNVNLPKIFKMVKMARRVTDIPIVFMTYYNPVLKYGQKQFLRDCVKSGVDGLIIPDLPMEESRDLKPAARKSKIALIFLAAPTSTRERLKNISRDSRGFIYYVSLTGVTGARQKLPMEVASKVKLIKSMTRKPVCVGFGVSSPQQAEQIANVADGVIIGSAVIKVIERNLNKGGLTDKVGKFVKQLADAIHNV
ncbi:MAG: tryptophan synthase subunit alpha [Candidatus Omnitrophica bacterium]|nr:tryptophan synthase subunit alpha [Candidatus Omnitrophota bacterium]